MAGFGNVVMTQTMIAGGVVTISSVFPLLITICKEYGIVRYGRTSTFLFMGEASFG